MRQVFASLDFTNHDCWMKNENMEWEKIMKKLIIAAAILSLTGCAAQPKTLDYSHVTIIASDESRKHPDYQKHYNDCDWYAVGLVTDISKSATSGALAGAGIASLMGLIVGVDSGYARLAGVGALAGGLSSAAGAKISNDQKYKEVMLRCLRERGYEVY